MKSKTLFFLRILIALILLQTLRFKFTAHPDSVYIFTRTGMEPYGRIAIGALEFVFAILLVVPKTVWMGSLGTLLIMSGALFFHLTKLGIEVNEDDGLLFYTAVFTFLACFPILWKERKKIPFVKTFCNR